MSKSRAALFLFLLIIIGGLARPQGASAQVLTQEWLCDSSVEDCREPVLNLIKAETVGIDIGFWFMEDSRYVNELIKKWQAGVPVRVLVDTKANTNYPLNATMIGMLKDAGIPIRRPISRYFHWKMIVFAGQNVVEFGSANFSPHAFVPQQPLVDFIDETIYFTNDPALVNSFKTRFDDNWVSTSAFTNYANVTGTLARSYPINPSDPNLNFPPSQDFGPRSVTRYNAESAATGGIDVMMYRITDARHTEAILAAHQRLVPIRMIIEQFEYREPKRWQHSYNTDRLIAAGIPVRQRKHAGRNHEKLTLLKDQQMAIFGSQNWSFTAGQYEHNYFSKKPWMYQWFVDSFNRKWNSTTETEPFVPEPPDTPVYAAPTSGSFVTTADVTLKWQAGYWAHKYDIYFGTSPNPPLLVGDIELGNSTSATDYVTYAITGLQADTTYYWKIVSKTMANMSKTGTVWNFRTGAPPTPGGGDVVMHAGKAPVVRGTWTVTADSTAASGVRIGTANAGVTGTASANPANYFEISFNANAGVPYRLWLRGKAVSNSWANDSALVQFSDSVTSSGTPTWQIGTTSATTVSIEDCTSCGLASWGWNDNLTNGTAGALGTPVYFATSGTHTIRVLMREDGLSIDQIVLSDSVFMSTAPGTTKNDGTLLPEQNISGNPPPPPPPPPSPLPAGWTSTDVGAVGPSGTANESNGTFTVQGAGADVWGTADAFHYAYRSMSGDGTITARVASLSGSQDWTKVGVMIRGSTAANSAQAFILVAKATKGLAFQYRTSDGATTQGMPAGTGTAPRWVRLTRTGNVITASISADGVAWTTVGSDTFTMPANVLVGLAVSSHTTSSLATGVFDNVTVP